VERLYPVAIFALVLDDVGAKGRFRDGRRHDDVCRYWK
jgi:hypothetical protein